MNYQFELYDITPLIHIFDSTIYVSKNTNIDGRFTNENNESIVLNTKIDTVQFGKINFYDNEININATNIRDQEKVLALGYISSEKQVYANSTETDKMVLKLFGTEHTWTYAKT